jgi:leucyl-tRNA synthetase
MAIPKYDFKRIEKKWQNLWLKKGIYEPNLKRAKRPFYNLMMFPYPSAEGLHVGNMYAFVGSDIYGRFQRMKGNDVFEPMGLDGFGIHSENYALKIKAHPMKQAKISEKRFYKQLQMIGNGFAWKEHLETYDPEYYKWTQWIFVQMFKNGLAYRKKQAVNWCPSCKTVLADEQVIAGECERCGSKVEKKELEQWFFKSTAYAERLLQNLETLDWSEKVKIAQRNWIGKSEGAEIEFEIKGAKEKIKVFTTRPDTLFGATYMVLAPEHPLIHKLEDEIKNLDEVKKYVKKSALKAEAERMADDKKKTGVELQGIKAINPANKETIPVWVSDYVLMGYGTGAIMAVPAHDARDFEFAKKFGLPVKKVIESESGAEFTENEGVLVDSGDFDGMSSERAKTEITKSVKGRTKSTYRLRDWLISRQRYWGAPIPMIFCEKCAKEGKGEEPTMPGWYSVPEKDLPVKLPFVKDFRPRGKGESPLASVESFYKVKCPSCKSWARRETDVSDTFLDSAWYYLRYPNAIEKKRPWSPEAIRKWFPVNMYIGGAEHSVLHLLYVRFLAMVLYDLGHVHFEEPMKKFRAHGLLIKEGSKMSKSKGNVVNPDEMIQKFGADTLRMYLMFLAPFEDGGDFRDAAILGVNRFLERVWKLAHSSLIVSHKFEEDSIEKHLHRTIKKVSEDIESLHYNTAISALMIFLNELESQKQIRKSVLERFVLLIAPLAPHLAEELWAKLGHKSSIHTESWPEYDERQIVEENFTLIIQVNGKLRDTLELPRSVSEEEVRRLILAREKIKSALQGKEPRTIIYVPHRIANIVI